jgi:hypothetical protein
MAKEIEGELVYEGGYIPLMDLSQDEIDKVKKMIARLHSIEPEEREDDD